MHYPALEISYLAIHEDFQGNNLGSLIVETIVDEAQQQHLGGCQFLTVEALSTEEYSAVGFYNSCGFFAAESPSPSKETLRMYRFLYFEDSNP